jgi:hypothetical protein
MAHQPTLRINGMANVKRAVGATEYVNEPGHSRRPSTGSGHSPHSQFSQLWPAMSK